MKSIAIPAKNLTILVNDMNISPRDLETHIGIASTSIRRCVKDGVASAPVEMAATNYLQMLQMRGARVPGGTRASPRRGKTRARTESRRRCDPVHAGRPRSQARPGRQGSGDVRRRTDRIVRIHQMSNDFKIRIAFDNNHLIINLWDDNWDLCGVGKVPLKELKFHMDRACEGRSYEEWKGGTK